MLSWYIKQTERRKAGTKAHVRTCSILLGPLAKYRRRRNLNGKSSHSGSCTVMSKVSSGLRRRIKGCFHSEGIQKSILEDRYISLSLSTPSFRYSKILSLFWEKLAIWLQATRNYWVWARTDHETHNKPNLTVFKTEKDMSTGLRKLVQEECVEWVCPAFKGCLAHTRRG